MSLCIWYYLRAGLFLLFVQSRNFSDAYTARCIIQCRDCDYRQRRESISVNFAVDNEGRESRSEESGNVTSLLLSVVYVPSRLKFLPGTSLFPLSSAFFAFIRFYPHGPGRSRVFCQVSPIKFVLCGHLRVPRCLGIPSANETEAPIRISRLPPPRDFRSFFPLPLPPPFPSYFSLFSLFPTEIFVVYASCNVWNLSDILTYSQKRWFREIDGWLPRPGSVMHSNMYFPCLTLRSTYTVN